MRSTLVAGLLVLVLWPTRAQAMDIGAAFRASDVAARLTALRQVVAETLDLGGGELLVVDYVPKQGALSEWDDESRLVLYRQTGPGAFERVQFVSKAGKSIPGRLAGLEAVDLDGDGTPEVLAIGAPHAPSGRVTSQVFRRGGPTQPFENIWQRKDHGAAYKTKQPDGDFIYFTLDMATFQPHREAFFLRGGQLVPRSPS